MPNRQVLNCHFGISAYSLGFGALRPPRRRETHRICLKIPRRPYCPILSLIHIKGSDNGVIVGCCIAAVGGYRCMAAAGTNQGFFIAGHIPCMPQGRAFHSAAHGAVPGCSTGRRFPAMAVGCSFCLAAFCTCLRQRAGSGLPLVAAWFRLRLLGGGRCRFLGRCRRPLWFSSSM